MCYFQNTYKYKLKTILLVNKMQKYNIYMIKQWYACNGMHAWY